MLFPMQFLFKCVASTDYKNTATIFLNYHLRINFYHPFNFMKNAS